MTKRSKTAAVAFAGIALTLTGCGRSMISAESIEQPVRNITERHDAYVENDDSLSDVERRTYLRSSEILNDLVDQALVEPEDQ